MQLNEIFAKDIQRPIEGVIKADDVAHLGTEVEEYVLTNEAAKGLEILLEEYTSYTNANGVWISGFFGSGKSHMLKMLAHLLGEVAGQDFPRQAVSDSFRAKTPDAFLPGLLDRAERIPAKSLLFNIDQKATLISKNQTDALLKVFLKVFDESRGYYGNQGHVARLERDLDRRGQYEAFKDAFQRIAGIPWSQGREQSALEGPNIDRAFAEVNGGTADGIIKQYSASHAISIEDFADEVKAWLDDQEDPGFRLNFFVDEVGQFIGSDTKLMLNLQTIAESLSTRCGGRSWVFVTSQEDIDKVIGDRTRQQGNDFSKIQARFKTRLKLTSADVEEVIRKRLLDKNEAGSSKLRSIYAAEHANFKTLFDFGDGGKAYRNYSDQSHFVGTYPFVSYQFPLFQAAIQGISDHNVFEGRNSSVGERSMLGVVQQVAKDIGNVEVGNLATFDSMFAGIRASLKSAAQRSIDIAERNLDNPLAIRLLKALFLVKYVESFHASPRNLTVLVYDRFGRDLPALSEQVKDALAVLETQTYVQRNGNTFEYLTNEEQVMEEEIKNVDIDSSEVSARLFKILSGEVIKANKIPYAKNGQSFPFGFKLDDQAHGSQRELAVHFISPEYPYSPEEIRMHSAGKDELRVILDPDARVLSDLRLLLKTEKYIKRKQSTALSASEERILRSKGAQTVERQKELVQRVRATVGRSTMIINAADISSSSQDPFTRVSDGFQELISRTYTQLKLLHGLTYTEQMVAGAANPNSDLFETASSSLMSAPAQEVLSYVTRRECLGEQVTVKTIVDSFTAKPYGWDLAAIEVLIAFLVGTSKVTITVDGNMQKRSEIATVLRNTHQHTHTVVTPQKTFDVGKIAAFRKFCTDFFDEPAPPTDPLELARHGADKLKSKRDELSATVSGSAYPFLGQLSATIGLLDAVVDKPADWYLTDFTQGDHLLAAKEDLIDPIQSFLRGGQRNIYDAARTLLNSNSGNLSYLPPDSASSVRTGLADPNAFRGDRMAQLKSATNELHAQIDQLVSATRTEISQSVQDRKAELRQSTYFGQASTSAQSDVIRTIDSTLARIESESQIAVIRQVGASFEENTYPALLDQLAASHTRPQPVKQTVSVKTITATGIAGLLETEQDVDRYLTALRGALVKTLNDGKRISL